MNTNSPSNSRPALDTFACVNERCTLYEQKGQDNLTVRKTYGKDGIRYLRCRCCGAEFSERKNTALWNTKVSEEKAVEGGGVAGFEVGEGGFDLVDQVFIGHRDTSLPVGVDRRVEAILIEITAKDSEKSTPQLFRNF